MRFADLLRFDNEMAYNGRVHPNCVNAPNPYHECGVACLEKIAQGQGRKEKKSLDNGNGVKEGVLSKKMDGERSTHPSCPKASNPFHECNKYCSYKSSEANNRGVQKQSGFLRIESFGKKQKGSEPVAKSPRGVNNASVVKSVDTASPRSPHTVANSVHPPENGSPQSPYTLENKVKSKSTQSSSSSQQHFEDSYFGNQSFDKGQGQSPESVLKSGNVMAMADAPQSPSKISLACFAIPTPTKQEEDEEIHTSPVAVSSPVAKNVQEGLSGPIVKSMEFTFSGISRASEESDVSDAQSVISDSCVSVGKYHVRANVASILQLIFAKYGDIAANYRLESTSLRAYYLECLCIAVQQLQSMSFKQLTKTKVKEMLAVVKDVETAGIDVTWLHGILDKLAEAMELSNQHETTEAAKADCDHALESSNNELESMMEDLAKKEKAVADAKTRIAEARSRMSELELESSELDHTISSITSKIEKISFKPLGDETML
uniref:Uncharacterized protein MANES_04G072100 n=2 Tax=Rhizophora mucronata TaxID=61149 RepID=A0A2P2JR39_RHIMU